MPRKKIRRFEPRSGVSAAMVDEEAKYLRREVEDYEVLSAKDLEKKGQERLSLCEHRWQHFELVVAGLKERQRKTLHALLFRDFYHILELYLAYLRLAHPEQATSPPSSSAPSGQFSEWLFKP